MRVRTRHQTGAYNTVCGEKEQLMASASIRGQRGIDGKANGDSVKHMAK